MTNPDPRVIGIRLSDLVADHEGRLFTFGEIAEEIGGEADTLRSWFSKGGLAVSHLDDVSPGGGRANRLHWRTVAALLIALKLNDYGFSKSGGEAAGAAGAAFTAGLIIRHFESTDGPLVAVDRDADAGVRVSLINRDGWAGLIETPRALDGFEGIGTLIIDPIGVGRIIWRMAWRQVQAEAAAQAMAGTFDAEEVEAGRTRVT